MMTLGKSNCQLHQQRKHLNLNPSSGARPLGFASGHFYLLRRASVRTVTKMSIAAEPAGPEEGAEVHAEGRAAHSPQPSAAAAATAGLTPTAVLCSWPNLIGYARIALLLAAWACAAGAVGGHGPGAAGAAAHAAVAHWPSLLSPSTAANAALCLFSASILLDNLDGYVARRTGQVRCSCYSLHCAPRLCCVQVRALGSSRRRSRCHVIHIYLDRLPSPFILTCFWHVSRLQASGPS